MKSTTSEFDPAHLAALSKDRPVRLRVGKLIDGTSDKPIPNADIVFDAKQIVSVDQSSTDRGEPDAVLPDYTALPCLIEAHAHMFLDGAPMDSDQRAEYLKQPADFMLARAKGRWVKILQCGIGAYRDAGDKHGVGLALAAEAKKHHGKLASTPWIDSPGAAIHHKGRYGSFMGEPIEDHTTPADCVAARVARGADRIKLIPTGIINFKVGQVTAPPQMTAEEVKALVEASHHYHRQTFAHASGTDGIQNAIDGGVNTVEHGFFITEAQLAQLRDKRIAWCPTFAPVQLQIDRAAEMGWSDEVVGHLKRIIEDHSRMLCKAREMGVTIIAGSDAGSCGVAHGLGFLWELTLMQRAGLSAMTILKSATGTSAATLDFAEPIGRIAPGCRARMILTRHDPAADVADLFKDKAILFDGAAVACDGKVNSEGL